MNKSGNRGRGEGTPRRGGESRARRVSLRRLLNLRFRIRLGIQRAAPEGLGVQETAREKRGQQREVGRGLEVGDREKGTGTQTFI